MQFFEAYRTTSKTSFAISPIQYHLPSRLASWMCIANSVTTTTSVMRLPSTHGLRVRELLSNTSLPDFALLVLDPRISYEGLKADYADNFMLSDHLEQLKANLSDYFDKHYVISTNMPMSSSAPSASLATPLVEGLLHFGNARPGRPERQRAQARRAAHPHEQSPHCDPLRVNSTPQEFFTFTSIRLLFSILTAPNQLRVKSSTSAAKSAFHTVRGLAFHSRPSVSRRLASLSPLYRSRPFSEASKGVSACVHFIFSSLLL
jgi:hypothetical protein